MFRELNKYKIIRLMNGYCLGWLLNLGILSSSYGLTFSIPDPGNDVVGDIKEVYALPDETLTDVGRRFDIGYYEMIEANPNLPADEVLPPRTRVVVPAQFILPSGPRVGLVINLAELRLYYYHEATNSVITEPVGIGREGWPTPIGETKIITKVKEPHWRPTKNVREDAQRLGYDLPEVVPPGPENPLGKFAMRLGWWEYLIHGTNRPEGVGRRSSAGCIRMFPEDIDYLFHIIHIGTPVRIINEPYKIGWLNGRLYFEAHTPLQEDEVHDTEDMSEFVGEVHRASEDRNTVINWADIKIEILGHSGMPVAIGQAF